MTQPGVLAAPLVTNLVYQRIERCVHSCRMLSLVDVVSLLLPSSVTDFYEHSFLCPSSDAFVVLSDKIDLKVSQRWFSFDFRSGMKECIVLSVGLCFVRLSLSPDGGHRWREGGCTSSWRWN